MRKSGRRADFSLYENGSNNADFVTNPFKLLNENGGDFHVVGSAGWYILRHVFYDAGGFLAVDLELVDSGGSVVWSATRQSALDTIPGEVGGNRYSWFTHIDTSEIAIDNHRLAVTADFEKADCKKGGWKNLFRADGSGFKNQGKCIRYVNKGK